MLESQIMRTRSTLYQINFVGDRYPLPSRLHGVWWTLCHCFWKMHKCMQAPVTLAHMLQRQRVVIETPKHKPSPEL